MRQKEISSSTSDLLEYLLKIDSAILAGCTLHKILYFIVKHACCLLHMKSGTLRLISDDGKVLNLANTYNVRRTANERSLKLDVESTAKRVFISCKPLAIPDISRDPLYPWKSNGKPLAMLTVPLLCRKKCIGVLSIYDPSPRNFDDIEIDTALLFANQAAMAIELTRLMENIEKRAITDFLTGLFNHRYFHERIEEEIARASRNNKQLSILFCDLDNFKRFNDIHGHLLGDLVLKRAGEVILTNKRKFDIATRYGGDEFALILPETNCDNAVKIANRICSGIRNCNLTMSIGISSYPEHGLNSKELLEKADFALNKTKSSGRDNIQVYHDHLV
ncbi:MAG: sensor domain-containing diguanylate cyclase [Actinobacteria bacterium]|nr:sensor domain-containing diguanylate cyclase [Actinomycetota bacterium]